MAITKPSLVGSMFVALLALAFAADQVVMSNGDVHRLSRPMSTLKTVKKNGRSMMLPSRGEKVSLRPENEFRKQGGSSGCRDSVEAKFLTFDDYWPSEDFPNATYESDWDGYLSFNNYNIMWADEAIDSGFLDSRDLNCAVSQPLALFNTPLNYTTSSVIRSNATALAEAGLSEYFDVVSWSWKPIGPYPKTLPFPWLELDLYRLNETGYEYVDGVGTIFPWFEDEDEDEPKFYDPDTWVPSEWFIEPWGTGVNWIEISTLFWDEDEEPYDERKFNYCLDNLVLLFYKKE